LGDFPKANISGARTWHPLGIRGLPTVAKLETDPLLLREEDQPVKFVKEKYLLAECVKHDVD